MTQFEDRRQQRIDKATAARNQSDWVKHTINLRSGSELDIRFKECGNKAHLVRESFKRLRELHNEVAYLRQENQALMSNIAKLQTVITDGFESAAAHPNQTKFEVEEE